MPYWSRIRIQRRTPRNTWSCFHWPSPNFKGSSPSWWPYREDGSNMQKGTSENLPHWEQRGLGLGLTLHHHGLQDVQTCLFVSFHSLLSIFWETSHSTFFHCCSNGLGYGLRLRLESSQRGLLYLGRLCPWPWRTCPLHNIKTHYDMHTHEVAVTNLKWNNLMLVTLCISTDNLMIL